MFLFFRNSIFPFFLSGGGKHAKQKQELVKQHGPQRFWIFHRFLCFRSKKSIFRSKHRLQSQTKQMQNLIKTSIFIKLVFCSQLIICAELKLRRCHHETSRIRLSLYLFFYTYIYIHTGSKLNKYILFKIPWSLFLLPWSDPWSLIRSVILDPWFS